MKPGRKKVRPVASKREGDITMKKLIYLDNAATTKTAPEVVEAMKKYSGVYFGAIGGAGALLAKCIKKAELVAYEDLQSEALRRL